MPSKSRPLVTVLGSLNLDYLATVERLPGAGETVPASRLQRSFGGKGANQALAAARQGAEVRMIGALGNDDGGRAYRGYFEKEGVGLEGVSEVRGEPTGTALIAVDARGENQIVVAAGANEEVTPALVRRQRALLAGSIAFLAQNEVPIPAIAEAMKIAAKAGVPIVFNPSPWREEFPWSATPVSCVIVNEHEARALLGFRVSSWEKAAARIRERLAVLQIATLIVTQGGDATWCFHGSESFSVQPPMIQPVDTVGAGDAFAGAFTAHLASGAGLRRAIGLANAAGALATLKTGAQAAIPTRAATLRAAAL